MTRINVYSYAAPEDHEGETFLAGWFNDDAATGYKEDTSWDGHNHVSINVGRHNHQELYRTKGARWVLHTWSQWEGSEPRFEFIDDAKAQDWLIRNAHDAAVKQWFGDLDEESGPNLGGRPQVGPKVEVRLDADTLAQVEARAEKEGITRAEMLRRLVVSGL